MYVPYALLFKIVPDQKTNSHMFFQIPANQPMYKISSNLNINTEHEKYTTGTKFRMHVNGSHIYITKKGPNARDASLIHDFEQ